MTRFTLAILSLLLFCTCKKVEPDVHNYYPKVKTTSVTLLPDGTVQVVGEVMSEGNSAIRYAGFCMDTIPDPGILSNQHSIDTLYGNSFTSIYTSLSINKKYYFRAWAANGNGYAIGEVLFVDSITISPSLIPCTLPLDTFTIGTTSGLKSYPYLYIDPIEQNVKEHSIRLNIDSRLIEITFSSKPINGIYKTYPAPNGENVVTIVIDGYTVESGARVYVTEIDASTIEVVICSAFVYDGIDMRELKTRFRASY